MHTRWMEGLLLCYELLLCSAYVTQNEENVRWTYDNTIIQHVVVYSMIDTVSIVEPGAYAHSYYFSS